jgi:uncharacterized protein (DUF433 family)
MNDQPRSAASGMGLGREPLARRTLVFYTRPKGGRCVTETGTVVLAFTTREAQQLTGLSARRLQYWDETAFIRPSVAARHGRGSPRLYSFRDLVQLRIAAILRDRLSLQALRRLKDALDLDAPFAEVRFASTSEGEAVYLVQPGVPEAVRRPGQIVMTFDVPLDEIRSDLELRIAELRRRRGTGRLEKNRGILSGRLAVAGTRITTAAIGRMLKAGWDERRILDEYPELTTADIEAVRRLGKTAG